MSSLATDSEAKGKKRRGDDIEAESDIARDEVVTIPPMTSPIHAFQEMQDCSGEFLAVDATRDG
jgi:hypothetical protein